MTATVHPARSAGSGSNNAPTDSDRAQLLYTADGVLLVCQYFTQLIQQYVAEYDYSTALWYAERQLAHILAPSAAATDVDAQQQVQCLIPAVLLQLAQIHLHNGSVNRANAVLQRHRQLYLHYLHDSADPSTHATAQQCNYLLAHTHYRLQQYKEAERCILASYASPKAAIHAANNDTTDTDSSSSICLPHGNAAWMLLGNICSKTGRVEAAVDCYKQCLHYDSGRWDAYQQLCTLGIDLPAQGSVFRDIQLQPYADFTPSTHIPTPHAETQQPLAHSKPSQPQFNAPNTVHRGPIPFNVHTPSVLQSNINATNFVTPAPAAANQSHNNSKYFVPPSRQQVNNYVTPAVNAQQPNSANSTPTVTPVNLPRGATAMHRMLNGQNGMMQPPSAVATPVNQQARATRANRLNLSNAPTIPSSSAISPAPSPTNLTTPNQSSDALDKQNELARNEKKLVRRSTRLTAVNSHEKLAKAPRLDLNTGRKQNATPRASPTRPDAVNPQSAMPAFTPATAPRSQTNSAAAAAAAAAAMPAPAKRSSTIVPNRTPATQQTPIARFDLRTPASPANHTAAQPKPSNDTIYEREHDESDAENEEGDEDADDEEQDVSNENIGVEDEDDEEYDENHLQQRSASEAASDVQRLATLVIAQLTTLLQTLADCYRLSSLYQCTEALSLIKGSILPHHPSHANTNFVLSIAGRSHLELADYSAAVAAYKRLRRCEPDYLGCADRYSTALWHMKQSVELSYLAQQCVAFDKLASESWVVVGNCFSLHKDHDTALTFFHRAVQLRPSYSYAHTLAAHESVATEDYDRAMQDYRRAIASDPRHYNAWYGLGNIYYRQESWQLAIYHFKHAIQINPHSCVLHCYLGMSLLAARQYHEALHALDRADECETQNPLAKFQRANVYVALNRWNDALHELEQLKSLAPKEASIHYLMGKIYRKQKLYDDALMCWFIAMDLDPKDRLMVKSSIDKLHAIMDQHQDVDVEEEEEALTDQSVGELNRSDAYNRTISATDL